MTLGFIGLGNMGSAILNGVLKKHVFDESEIYVSRKHPELASDYASQGIHICSNVQTAQLADTVILAVKPQILESVLDEIHDLLAEKNVISIAAAWPPERLSEHLPESTQFVCVMPNVPVAVGQGCTIINEKGRYQQETLELTQRIFESIGVTEIVGESIYNACGVITGCGPAYIFEMVEALCDAAVINGISKPLAQRLVAQMMLGSAEMVLETGKHPCALKDSVCSPGGTTIEGVRALHEHGFHAAVISAVNASIEKEKQLKK